MPSPSPAIRSALPILVAAAGSVGLAVLCLWPALASPGAVLLGDWAHPDCLSNHWLLAWVAERLLAGEGILHNPDYYWPVGDAPVLAGNGAEGVLYLPFHALLGWPRAVPAYALLVLTLNGLSGYALARAAGAGPWVSLAAVGVTGCFPYATQELSAGRFTQAAVFWPGFALAAWVGLLHRPGRGRAVMCGALTAAAGFFYWYHALFVCLADAILLAAFLASRPPRWPWREGLLAAGTALLLIAPWAALFASAWAAIPGTEEAFPSHHAAFRSAPLTPRMLTGEGASSAWAISAPLGLLGLAGAGLALRRGDGWRGRGLLVCAVVFGLLALGPTIPASPYVALYGLAAPLRRFWWPVRHVVVVNLAWAALGATALHALARSRPRRAALGLGLGALLLAPLGLAGRGIPLQPRTSAMALPPKVYPALGEEGSSEEVLLAPPLWPGLALAQQHLIDQRYHRKRLLGGHALWVDRLRPPAWDAFVAGNSFLAALQGLEQGLEQGERLRFAAADLAALQGDGVRWFVVDRELFPLQFGALVERYRALGEALFGQPHNSAPGAGVWLWDMRAWDGQTDAVELAPWAWPAGVRPGGPDISITGRRFPSDVFSDGRQPPPPAPAGR